MTSLISASIIILSFSIAFYIIHIQNSRIKALNLCIKLVTEIKQKALLYNKSFFDIVAMLNETGAYSELDFIRKFTFTDGNPALLWKDAVENSSVKLSQYEKDVLISLCSDLASCPKSQIEEFCSKAVSELTDFKSVAGEKKEKNIKTGAIFTVSIGIMLVLTFI